MFFESKHNSFRFEPYELFVNGTRRGNKKRNFLFISRVLGKHLAVHPETVRCMGYLLSSLKYGRNADAYVSCIRNPGQSVPCYTSLADDRVLVIGFSETATGLGMAAASAIQGCTYITTTREEVNGMPVILSFEEEHSHAVSHRLYSDRIKISDFRKVILVDDEITTGKTMLNLMKQIEKVSHMDEYSIMTIMDSRSSADKKAFHDFAVSYKTNICEYCILRGTPKFEISNKRMCLEQEIPEVSVTSMETSLHCFERETVLIGEDIVSTILHTGRFGVSYDDIIKIEEEAELAAARIAQGLYSEGKKILILGHGENIYIPSRIAAYLEHHGFSADFKTTTLSPIAADGHHIRDAVSFKDRGKTYFYYNTADLQNYGKVIMIRDIGDMPVLQDNNYSVYYV